MAYNYSDDIISDLHKDARGFRPCEYFWEQWTQAPADVKQSIWDNLCDEMESNQAQEEAAEARAIIAFRKLVAAQMQLCKCGWKDALRFLADAEDMDLSDAHVDIDFFLWGHGISYSERKKIAKLYYNG